MAPLAPVHLKQLLGLPKDPSGQSPSKRLLGFPKDLSVQAHWRLPP